MIQHKKSIKLLLYGIFCSCFLIGIFANGQTTIRQLDKIRIKEAITISKQFGNALWPGFNEVPFVILLVTDSVEFLMFHPDPSADFQLSVFDTLLGINIFYRKKIFDKHLLATFPAVKGVPCIVVGTPENTSLNSTEWVITLLHEHFHQYQDSQKDYYSSVNDLDLAGDDKTGMWMLNYPFPYDSMPVQILYKEYMKSLLQAVKNIGNKNFTSVFAKYKIARQKFKRVLSVKEYRYFSFQVWQEGLSRFTEYLFLIQMKNYQPSKAFRNLPGYEDFNHMRRRLFERETRNLISLSLNTSGRVCFYSIGFAEGLLLNEINPIWRRFYFSKKFFLERYFDNRPD
jgi:hypothetical protein